MTVVQQAAVGAGLRVISLLDLHKRQRQQWALNAGMVQVVLPGRIPACLCHTPPLDSHGLLACANLLEEPRDPASLVRCLGLHWTPGLLDWTPRVPRVQLSRGFRPAQDPLTGTMYGLQAEEGRERSKELNFEMAQLLRWVRVAAHTPCTLLFTLPPCA